MTARPIDARMVTAAERLYVLGAAIGITTIFFIDLCGALFGCGCRSLWSGAAALCNIHNEMPPHCPWCAHPVLGGAVAFFAVVGAQAATIFAPADVGFVGRTLLALAAFPLVGAAVGWLQGMLLGYWG